MTLADAIQSFIEDFIKTTEYQHYSGYEDILCDRVHELYSLCTTDSECAIVKAIVALEEH